MQRDKQQPVRATTGETVEVILNHVAAETAYFTVALLPGEYAWIAEEPNPDDKGMFVPFTVGR